MEGESGVSVKKIILNAFNRCVLLFKHATLVRRLYRDAFGEMYRVRLVKLGILPVSLTRVEIARIGAIYLVISLLTLTAYYAGLLYYAILLTLSHIRKLGLL